MTPTTLPRRRRQGETIDLDDGLRARLRPGQRSVEIERRADNGLFGAGIGARWEAVPLDAELSVEEGGATALAASGNAMVQPPKKGEEGEKLNHQLVRTAILVNHLILEEATSHQRGQVP